ncbi:MAG: aldo/keto reductase [Treponema sp.]|jgi:aryl-alcohol dehydrogenase-like predicted oxidoreductase|nr:aldo/keto reductase [Treponema sp.]
MESTVLGSTGRRVSRIGYGGTLAGLKNYTRYFDPEEGRNKEQLIEALLTAFKLGINYFDTAAGYGNGVSERIFGEALASIPKEQIFLATKVSFGDAAKTRASLEGSLKNLRRDWVDLIQIHGSLYRDEQCDAILGPGGMAEALEKAKEEGLVKHIGFSIECQNIPLYRFIRSGRFEVMQIQYNLLFQHPYDPSFTCGSLYEAEECRMGIVTMRTLTSGIFQRWIQRVNPQNTFDYTPALLQFNLSNPLVDVALLGMNSADQVRANVAVCEDLPSRIDMHDLHTRYADKQAQGEKNV